MTQPARQLPQLDKLLDALTLEVLNSFTELGIKFSLDYDVDYGFMKVTGWTLVIDGVAPMAASQFLPTPAAAIILGISDYIKYHDTTS